MKRLLAVAIAGLMLASTASAKLLIVTPRSPDKYDMANLSMLKTILNRTGQREGTEYRVVSWRDITTYQCRRGVHYWGETDSTQYDVVWHIGFSRGRHNVTGTTYWPDSLSIMGGLGSQGKRTFPLKWQVFYGSGTDAAVPSLWTPAVYCSLSAVGTITNGTTARDTTYSAYVVNGTQIWKPALQDIVNSAARGGGGYIRYLVSYATNANSNLCHDCDSISTGANRAHSGTAVMWAVGPDAPGAVVDGQTMAGIVCVQPPAAIGAGSELIWLALCKIDSLSGHKVFERTTGLPLQESAIIMFGYSTGAESFTGSGGLVGIRQSSLATLKEQADSINTLNCKPTVGYDPDSLTANNWQDAVFSRITGVRYAPSPSNASGAVFGDASATHPVDPMGRARSRAAFGDNSATGADTSLHALLKASIQLGAVKFGTASVERTLIPAGYSWTPSTLTTMTSDSLFSAMRAAGISRLIVASEFGTGPGQTQPFAWKRDIRPRYGVGATHTGLGIGDSTPGSTRRPGSPLGVSLATSISSIGSDRYANSQNAIQVAQNYANRCLAAMFFGRSTVYPDGDINTTVNLGSDCAICGVSATGMGAADNGLSVPFAGQWTFRVLKHVDAIIDAGNIFAGRTVAEWAYPTRLRR